MTVSLHKRGVFENDLAKCYHFIKPRNAEACRGILRPDAITELLRILNL